MVNCNLYAIVGNRTWLYMYASCLSVSHFLLINIVIFPTSFFACEIVNLLEHSIFNQTPSTLEDSPFFRGVMFTIDCPKCMLIERGGLLL